MKRILLTISAILIIVATLLIPQINKDEKIYIEKDNKNYEIVELYYNIDNPNIIYERDNENKFIEVKING